MSNFSIFSLARNAMYYHEDWQKQWRSPAPKREYDAIIVGGGGHGLATAYYMAKLHGMRNIAVIERGWLGGGNTARNTTIVRSNYLWDESTHLYEKAMVCSQRCCAALSWLVSKCKATAAASGMAVPTKKISGSLRHSFHSNPLALRIELGSLLSQRRAQMLRQ